MNSKGNSQGAIGVAILAASSTLSFPDSSIYPPNNDSPFFPQKLQIIINMPPNGNHRSF